MSTRNTHLCTRCGWSGRGPRHPSCNYMAALVGPPNIQVVYQDTETRERAPLRPAKAGDAGMDLYNASRKTVVIQPNETVRIPAGIRIKLPDGYVGLVRPRSSTFLGRGLLVIEGTLDAGYTGPLCSTVYNPGFRGLVEVGPWERLAQLVVVEHHHNSVEMVEELPETERAATGFGSSGK